MNAVSNGTLRDLPGGDLVFIGGYQNNAALLRFDNSGTFITAKYFGNSRDQHGTSFHAEAEGNAGFTFVGPSEVAITSGITTTINLDFRVGRTTVGFATGCEEGDFIPTVINREVIPRIILPSFEDVTNRTPRTAIHGPLNWTENVICQNCTCVPVIDISCDYEIAGPGVVIDWDPAPGTITFVEVRRDGELIGTVDGNTFTDDPSPGLHRYEMSFFNNEPSCAPTRSVCDVEVSPSVPIQLVTDLVIRTTDENADESTICLVADLEELGRTPQLVTSTELLSAELGSEHPQHNPVAWLLLGEYPHQQPLSDSDNEQLVQYLLSGGSLYIEGADVGFSVSADLQNALGFTALEQGSANGEVPVLEGLNSEHGLDLPNSLPNTADRVSLSIIWLPPVKGRVPFSRMAEEGARSRRSITMLPWRVPAVIGWSHHQRFCRDTSATSLDLSNRWSLLSAHLPPAAHRNFCVLMPMEMVSSTSEMRCLDSVIFSAGRQLSVVMRSIAMTTVRTISEIRSTVSPSSSPADSLLQHRSQVAERTPVAIHSTAWEPCRALSTQMNRYSKCL